MLILYVYGIYLLATNQSSRSVNPGTLDVGRSSDVGVNGASGHGNSGEIGDTCSYDVEMSDMRDCVPNDSYFQRDTATPDHAFTIAEEIKYARRYEEGYDLPDARYEKWLRLNHPKINVHSNSMLPTPNTPLLSEVGRIFPVTLVQTSPVQASRVPDTNKSTKAPSFPAQRSPLADVLNIPTLEKSKKQTTTGKARVLTSAECLKILKDKENEKRLKAEEKEKRKQDRLEKKKQREEELKRKEEEKARKKAEKEKCKSGKRKRSTASSQSQNDLPVAKRPPPEPEIGSSETSSSGCSEVEPPRRSRKVVPSADDEIDVNRCCVCFGMYADDIGTGREWLKCKCTRWIHEDCIDDDDVVVESGKFCPLC